MPFPIVVIAAAANRAASLDGIGPMITAPPQEPGPSPGPFPQPDLAGRQRAGTIAPTDTT